MSTATGLSCGVVWTPDDDAVAASHSVDPAQWRVLFNELMFLIAGRFGRVEPRRAARGFMLGLLAPLEQELLVAEGTGWAPGSAGDAATAVHRGARRRCGL